MKKKQLVKFKEIPFEKLMSKRIYKILLVSSTYDAFLLEQDGRINEMIFKEYTSLNLRYPPEFIHVTSAKDAFDVLDSGDIDLIITMLSIGDMDPFSLAKQIKQWYYWIPIVILTPFSRSTTLRLAKDNLSSIDYIFSWLGNTDILLAIIKLIEDKMNVENDVKLAGVDVILLVEDSIRFYSSYLPLLYKILFEHSKTYEKEVLNPHQQMLRKRGRPKILLATTFEEAAEIFNKYKNNILGVISDVSFPKNGKKTPDSGFELARLVKNTDPYIPFLLQSSDLENGRIAKELKVSFLYKNSPKLLHELRKFVKKYFGFGDFVFVDPQTKEEILRVPDLKSMQKMIFQVPEASLKYHLERNHLSKWLNSRALFNLAQYLKNYRVDEFSDIDEIRTFVSETIKSFRKSQSRTVIAEFEPEKYDEYITFARVGEGMLGGKARGLAFLNLLKQKHPEFDEFEGINVSVPHTVVLATDIFDEFMQENNLIEVGLSDLPDEEILKKFVEASLPSWLDEYLLKFVEVIGKPIAVRSSSLLEDAHYQPFAGVYSTYMIPNFPDKKQTLFLLKKAIKSVYASVYFAESKAYMKATQNVIDEEKMGIVLQEVCGSQYGDKFYPVISGVARSINFYPVGDENPEDGIVNLAFGLGKQIVEGETVLRYSPGNPGKILQLSDPKTALRETQKTFYALDLSKTDFEISTDDAITLKKFRIKEAEKDGTLDLVASVYDFQNDMLRDGTFYEGKKVITFNPVLKYNKIPLNDVIKLALKIGRKAMNMPVEIEFAVDIDPKGEREAEFNLLQIRPIVDTEENIAVDLTEIPLEETVIFSRKAMGNGVIDNISDIVYVRQENFDPANNPKIAEIIKAINEKMMQEGRNYILIGPGRWGSRDPWLGIPVKWAFISAARVIVEAGLENYRIEPSQGTHFFQNLTSFRVGYFTVNPYIRDGFYDYDFLQRQPAIYEDDFVRHIRFEKTLSVKIDGRKRLGVIMKP